MAEKYIRIHGELIEVTDEVYYAYYHMGRQRKTQTDKDARRKVASYDALDTEDHLGIDLLEDRTAISVEEEVIAHVMAEKLHRCLAQLSQSERELIHALYFEGMSERKTAQALGIPHMTVHNRKKVTLQKLKNMMSEQK